MKNNNFNSRKTKFNLFSILNQILFNLKNIHFKVIQFILIASFLYMMPISTHCQNSLYKKSGSYLKINDDFIESDMFSFNIKYDKLNPPYNIGTRNGASTYRPNQTLLQIKDKKIYYKNIKKIEVNKTTEFVQYGAKNEDRWDLIIWVDFSEIYPELAFPIVPMSYGYMYQSEEYANEAKQDLVNLILNNNPNFK